MLVKRKFGLSAGILLLLVPILYAQPQVSELRITGRGDAMRARTDLTDTKSLPHKKIEVTIAGREDYRERQLQYSNLIDDLRVEYKRANSKKGDITIIFPYEPVDDTDLLLRVQLPDGVLFYHWPINMATVRSVSAGDDGAVVRIRAAEASGGADTDSGGGGEREKEEETGTTDPSGLRVDTVRGDTWHNLANTVRHAYLRQENVNTEQVMLALRSKNPDAFVNDAVLRVGVSLVLPAYYEIRARNGEDARQAVRRLLAKRTASRPRLELASPEDKNRGGVAAAEEEQDASEREEAETSQRLAAVNEQLEQVEKLIVLKEKKLEEIERVAAEEIREIPEDSNASLWEEESRRILELLLARAQQLRSLILANPLFWILVFLGIAVCPVFLFYFWRWLWRHHRSPRGRAAVMRNLRRSGGASEDRTLFDARLTDSSDEPDEEDIRAVRQEQKRAAQPAERMQDNLVNANLDLARAYINMGESKKARALLKNVAAEGTAAEKSRAEDLLKTIKNESR